MHSRFSSYLKPAAAAFLVFSAGCDTASAGDDDDFAVGCETSTAVKVDPTGTYLRTHEDPASAPTMVRLADFGLAPGDRVTLQQLGEYQYTGNVDRSATREKMVGVFSSSDVVLPRTERSRVPGAIRAGSNYGTLVTLQGGFPTDIPEDFLIANVTVVVPAGAAFLFLTPDDDFFSDNLDEDEDYRVCITPQR